MTKPQIYGASGGLAIVTASLVAVAVAIKSDNAPLEIKYEAPAVVQVGTLGIIDLSATGADAYAVTVYPPLSCAVVEGGTKVIFSSPSGGQFTFVAAACKDSRIGLTEIVVQIEGDAPGPAPPTPDGFERRLAAAVRAVKSDSKAAQLDKLISTFETVASMTAAGVIRTPEDLDKALKDGNKDVIADPAWAGARQVISQELSARADAGTLNTIQDHVAACREIAKILRSVKDA